MTEATHIEGYPSTALQFLADLQENNNRDWFNAHKQTYLGAIVAPTQAFVANLGLRLKTISPDIVFDTRSNGQGSMMRIYRDIRFSQDKSPYKTWVGVVFWEGPGKKMHVPSFYFHLEATGAFMYGGIYQFPKALLSAYRDALVDVELGGEFDDAIAQVTASGDYSLYNEPHYKRVPRGYDPEHPRAQWLKYSGFGVSSPHISSDQLASPDLVDICYDHCRNMAPIQQWLVKLTRQIGPLQFRQ